MWGFVWLVLALAFEQEQLIIGHKYTTQVIISESILPHHRVARSLNSSKHVVFAKHCNGRDVS
jgi:hypothetical protein